jgi:hypothetical protein
VFGYTPDFFVVDDPHAPKADETDEDFRIRIDYVAGEGRTARELEHAKGSTLDAIAEEFGLKRRRVS